MRWLGSIRQLADRHLIRPLARPPLERPSVFQTYIGERSLPAPPRRGPGHFLTGSHAPSMQARPKMPEEVK
ncbi:MAG: hypothetical protein A3B10_00855 [Candidatus Doudnabacteria bacterium RIFCSPLOWO2_01_FULL_44_21]|uniref:Uncharacterized protein n=1 Tax=Candidatus Doudnabacteria bacterium RIFCSPLOWO2_01_FULL_44_21 TaxID=1817841 RepID=A0A1F5PXE0_9BACT|nr:MAG: hypothetical protein A3B10_00855 [Candidatus Doudnabacteria bacterium RIFCSPLOWO2_01_FULL_44_21]